MYLCLKSPARPLAEPTASFISSLQCAMASSRGFREKDVESVSRRLLRARLRVRRSLVAVGLPFLIFFNHALPMSFLFLRAPGLAAPFGMAANVAGHRESWLSSAISAENTRALMTKEEEWCELLSVDGSMEISSFWSAGREGHEKSGGLLSYHVY